MSSFNTTINNTLQTLLHLFEIVTNNEKFPNTYFYPRNSTHKVDPSLLVESLVLEYSPDHGLHQCKYTFRLVPRFRRSHTFGSSWIFPQSPSDEPSSHNWVSPALVTSSSISSHWIRTHFQYLQSFQYYIH